MTKRFSWPRVSTAFVQKNLTGHKILGLAAAGILYLICLSGTLTVFYLDMQRWEAGGVPDAAFRSEGVATALMDARAHLPQDATYLSATTPTHDNPRLTIVTGSDHRGYDVAGRYAGNAATPATDGLTVLHYYLQLPSTLGGILVGLGGVAIVALLIGGLLAHPRIFKDAFLWRFKAGTRLNRSDLHNRVGVWASPFHLIVAATGAIIALSQVVALVAGLSFYKGDAAAAGAALYGTLPVANAPGTMDRAALVAAFTQLDQDFPGVQPDYVTVNNLGSGHESLTVWAEVPDRLIYGEQFEFDSSGKLAARHHLDDGDLGKQAFASLYRLHFGSFGGIWVRWAFTALGFGLTLLCTTGMDIWLLKSAQKGRPYPRLHKGWAGFVWGAPIAIVAASNLCLVGVNAYAPVLWSLLVVLTAGAVFAPSLRHVSMAGRLVLAALLVLLVAAHAIKFGAASWAGVAMWMNVSLLAAACLCGWSCVSVRR